MLRNELMDPVVVVVVVVDDVVAVQQTTQKPCVVVPHVAGGILVFLGCQTPNPSKSKSRTVNALICSDL